MKYPSDLTDKLKKKGICGVLSLAIIANVSFAQATQAAKNNMMSFQKRHGGATYPDQLRGALKELGVRFGQYSIEERRNLQTTVRTRLKKDTTYMILTSRHVVTVRNGVVADQAEILPIAEHCARRCFVTHILEIL